MRFATRCMTVFTIFGLMAISVHANGPKSGTILVGFEAGAGAGTATQTYTVAGVETEQNMPYSIIGAVGMYQLDAMIQLGAGVGFQLQEDQNLVFLSPQARFLIDVGFAKTQLLADAQLRLLFGDAASTSLAVRAGLQSWLTSSLALYGGIGVMDIGFSPSNTTFGFLQPFVGIQFALE